MEHQTHRYFILNKPYDMVTQFKSNHGVRLLSEIDFDFPEGTHAIGRLDRATQGLLILTTNKKVTKLLFQGIQPHKRTYHVLVQHIVSEATLEKLRKGVSLLGKENRMFVTTPCDVEIVDDPNFDLHIPYNKHPYCQYTWLKMSLTEGKFHQVRKMVASVGHKCIQLVRTSIEDLKLGELKEGGVREIDEQSFFQSLYIDYNFNL